MIIIKSIVILYFLHTKFQMPIEWLISCSSDILLALLKTWQYAQSLVAASLVL